MLTIYQVDSFSDVAFKGNPAAVCILDDFDQAINTDQWHADIAAEMNLSETAFAIPQGDRYHLRWFTPAVEVELCGHATLATAHILRETQRVSSDETIRFETLSGELRAGFDGNDILLDFPSTPPLECVAPGLLIEGLNVAPLFCGKTTFDFMVEVEDENTVRSCRPDFTKLREFGVRGVMVTAKSDDDQFDFVSRFFAPGAGIDEDPVTGSAHCALAPFWSERLKKIDLVGYQASQRGGVVGTRLQGDRVVLSGKAVTVLKCSLLVPQESTG